VRLLKVIYGPVASWRLGKSLGIDLICNPEKICCFDCAYCQLEKTKKITSIREKFISTDIIKKELKEALKVKKPDVITLSGMGEPTLAKNIKETIDETRKLTDIPIAILTNSTLLYKNEVKEALLNLDIIVAKLDASNEQLFKKINNPASNITFQNTVFGIKEIRKEFRGKFAIQTMFMKENISYANELAEITRKIKPDEVQINTPLRACNVKPLSIKELDKIQKKYIGLNTISVYHSKRPMTDPLDKMELIKRRRFEP
jgi:wyosine [tRNA(Phe)-imidazoG37] synthetase (radical SAM superfamily)